MYLQIHSEAAEERNSESARIMLNKVCHKAYAVFLRRSHVCTHNLTFQVVYANLRSNFIKPGGITMVLAQSIERLIIYLVPSRNTIRSGVVLAHGIDKG